MDWESRLRSLCEEHGTEDFVRQAMDELGYENIEDVPDRVQDYVTERAKALKEENQ